MDTKQLFEILPLWETKNRIRIEPVRGCWLWQGRVDRDGYGVATTYLVPNTQRAHRISYILLAGEIPAGLTLDHECEVRNCVNPDHLNPCTVEENIKAGAERRILRAWQGPLATATQLRIARGICVSGHVLAEVGVLRDANRPDRARCKACQHETQRKNRIKNGIEVGESRGSYGNRDPKRPKSKQKGVSWNNTTGRWKVAVYYKGKTTSGGEHKLEQNAIAKAKQILEDLQNNPHPR